MRGRSFNSLVCSLLAAAMLLATSQYLAHFHIPRSGEATQAHLDQGAGHGAEEHCGLCLQFDRLPALPPALELPAPYFLHIATLAAERLERLALQTPYLWPPSRGPPALTC